MLLIVMISAVIVWLPRRELLAMSLAGARVELIHPIEQLPVFRWSPALQGFLSRNHRRLIWLGTDDDVSLIGLSDPVSQGRLLRHLTRFPNCRTLILRGSLVDQLGNLGLCSNIHRVFIEGDGADVDWNGLSPLTSLRELKLRNLKWSVIPEPTIPSFEHLQRIDVYESHLPPALFAGLGRFKHFSGVLAFHGCHGIDAMAFRQIGKTHVVRLELKSCFGIGDEEIRGLRNCPSLRFLQLENAHVSQKEIQRLQNAMPSIQIDQRWHPNPRGPSVNGGISF